MLDPKRRLRGRRDGPERLAGRGLGQGRLRRRRRRAARHGRRERDPRPLGDDAGRLPRHAHAAGILTAHGGLTSHAAVVARGEGIPCVTGCEALHVEPGRARRSTATSSREGDTITIDGGDRRGDPRRRRRSSRRRSTRTSRRSSSGPTGSAGCRCARTPTRPRTRPRRASSAPRASASAGPSTCSRPRSGCRSCAR